MKTPKSNNLVVKALNLHTDELICQGNDIELVKKEAEESGKDFILDFEADDNYSYIY